MKTRIITTLGLVLLMVQVQVIAQTAAGELQKISEKFLSFKSFQTDFQYLLYSDATMKRQVEKQRGSYYMQGSSSYVKALNTETVTNEHYQVTVNHDQRMILTNKIGEQATSPADFMPMYELNRLKEKSGRIALINISKELNEVTVQYNTGRMQQMKIRYNPATHEVKEVHIQFRDEENKSREKPYLVIRYSSTRCNHSISKEVFSEKRFVEIRQGKAVPVPALAKYKLLANL